jgi:hypothetical protein
VLPISALTDAQEGLASGVPNGRTIEAPQPRYTPSAAANLLSTLIISDPYVRSFVEHQC